MTQNFRLLNGSSDKRSKDADYYPSESRGGKRSVRSKKKSRLLLGIVLICAGMIGSEYIENGGLNNLSRYGSNYAQRNDVRVLPPLEKQHQTSRLQVLNHAPRLEAMSTSNLDLSKKAVWLSASVKGTLECEKYAQLFLDIREKGAENKAGFANALSGATRMAQEAKCLSEMTESHQLGHARDVKHAVGAVEATAHVVGKGATSIGDYILEPMKRGLLDPTVKAKRAAESILPEARCAVYRDHIIALGNHFTEVSGYFTNALLKAQSAAASAKCTF